MEHGQPMTLAELRATGLSKKRVIGLEAAGRLRRVLHGVYVDASAEDTVDLRLAAARKVIAPGSVVRDRTAAWLHGVDVFGYAEGAVLPPIETCVLPDRSPTTRQGVDGRRRDLLPRDLMVLGGLTVTTPLRTALDLGCHLKRMMALAALDQFKNKHGLTDPELLGELPRFRGRRGVCQLRPLIPLSDPRAESVRESWTRLAIIDEGLPVPELQYWIVIGCVQVWRLDHAYPRHKVAVEYNGEEWHDRTEEQRENNRKRIAWLERNGWIVIVVRKADFIPGYRGTWLDELAEALDERRTSTMRPFMSRAV